MARTISADSKGELPKDAVKPPRVLENLATEADMQRAFVIYKDAERTYEAFQADQRQQKTAAKAVRDKALTDSVVMVASRGITKKTMRKLYERSLLDTDDLQAEIKAEVWGMRAAGLPVGTQLAFFDEPFKDGDEALRRAYVQGRDAYVEKKTEKQNPYHVSSQPGQRWMEGFRDAQNDVIMNMQKTQ